MTKNEPLVLAEQQRRWIAEDAGEVPSTLAWRQFLLELRVAQEFATRSERNSETPPGRTAIMQALVSLSDFLNKHDVVQRNGLSVPFTQLMQAFYDLQNGHRPPVLSPAPPGRGGITRQAAKSNLVAIAARALDELLSVPEEQRVSLTEAARLVARTIQAARLPGHEKCRGQTVERWRENIKAGERGTEKVAGAVLDRWRAPLPPEAGTTARTRADFLLFYIGNSPTLRWE